MRGGRVARGRLRTLLPVRVWVATCAPLLLAPGASALSLAGLARLLGYESFPASAGDVLCHLLAGITGSVEPLWYLTMGILTCGPLVAVMVSCEPGAAFVLAYGSRGRAWAHRLALLVVLLGTAAAALVLGCVLWSLVLGGSPSLAAPHGALAVWTKPARPDGRAPDDGSGAAVVLSFLALAWLASLALVSVGHLLATFTGMGVASVMLLAYLVLVAVARWPWLPAACVMATRSPFFGAPGPGAAVQVVGSLLAIAVSDLVGGWLFSRSDLGMARSSGRGARHA